MEGYGKCLMPKGYKFRFYLILFLLVTPLLSYLIIHTNDILLITLSSLVLILIIIAIEYEPVAYENGIRVAVSSLNIGFIPYKDIVYICGGVDIFSNNRKGILVIYKIERFYKFGIIIDENTKYSSNGINDTKRTPLDKIIPCMKKHIPNWDEVYHPEVTFDSFSELEEFIKKLNV